MNTFIYYLHNGNKIPFYIGKTNSIQGRKGDHRKKFGKNIQFEIIDEVSLNEWKFWESHYIFLYRSWGFILENKNFGGGGSTTITFTNERNQKISKKTKGKSKSHKGKLFSDEHKSKIKLKRSHLKERKNTWSQTPVIQYDLNGTFIREFESQIQAQVFMKKPNSDGVGAVCRGKQPTAYGFIWKFKQN